MKNMKRLLAIVLAVVIVGGMMPSRTFAEGERVPYNSSITFRYADGDNGATHVDRQAPYLAVGEDGIPVPYKNGEQPENWSVYYDTANGVLTLRNYVGPKFSLTSGSGDLTIKLIGTNVINSGKSTVRNYGIQDLYGRGELKITSDAPASLTINVSSTGDYEACGIDLNMNRASGTSFVLGGKAHLFINASAEQASYQAGAIGIYALEAPVTIQDDASFTARIVNTANCAAFPEARCGIFCPQSSITIDTTGDFDVDCSQHVTDDDKARIMSSMKVRVVNVDSFTAKTSSNQFSYLAGSDDYWPQTDAQLDSNAYWFEKIINGGVKTYSIYKKEPGSQHRVFLDEPKNHVVNVGSKVTARMDIDKSLVMNAGFADVAIQELVDGEWKDYFAMSVGGYGGSWTIDASDVEVTKTFRWEVLTHVSGAQYSNEFTITWAYGKFVKQPVGGTAEAGKPYTVSFETNVQDGYLYLQKYDSETDTWILQNRFPAYWTSCNIPYGTAGESDTYRIFIPKVADGTEVYSDEFNVVWDDNIFKTQPAGGTHVLNEKHTFSFAAKDYAKSATFRLERKVKDGWYDMGVITSPYSIPGAVAISKTTYRVVCTYGGAEYYSNEFNVSWEDGGYVRIRKDGLIIAPDGIAAGNALCVNIDVLTDDDILSGYIEGLISWIYISENGEVSLIKPEDPSSLTITEDMLGGSVYCEIYSLDDVAWMSKEIVLTESFGSALLGYSLSLTDQIGVNFHMEIAEAVLADRGAYMEFNIPGVGTKKVALADADMSYAAGRKCYVFSCAVAPKQVTDSITARLVMSSGKSSEEYTFAVADYIDYIYENSENYAAETLALVKAINLYGYYAQKYFGYNLDNLVDISRAEGEKLGDNMLETLKISCDATELSEIADTLSAMGIGLYGGSMILESKVKLRLYFDMSEAIAADFTSGVNTVQDAVTGESYNLVKSSDGLYYIESKAYYANEGMKPLHISINVGGESVTIKYYTFRYCADALASGLADAKLRGLVNAYVNYTYTANLLAPYTEGVE